MEDTNATLIIAVGEGKFDQVRELLHRPDFHVESLASLVPAPTLLPAAIKRADIMELLLDHRANVNAVDECNRTPLFMAAMAGKQATVECLLAHHALPQMPHDIGCPTLLAAVEGRNRRVLEMIIQHRANVNAQSKFKTTALQHAARRGYMEMVDCLLEYGADPAIIGEHDKTAGECAASKEIRKLIASPRFRWSKEMHTYAPAHVQLAIKTLLLIRTYVPGSYLAHVPDELMYSIFSRISASSAAPREPHKCCIS